MDRLVFTWGRFNPPHIGHERIVSRMRELSAINHACVRLYATHTQGKNDPLDYETKMGFLESSFPGVPYRSDKSDIISLLKSFDLEGFKRIYWVVGSDRKDDIERISGYNGKEFNFDHIGLHYLTRDYSRGGVLSASATKMRRLAHESKKDEFVRLCPSALGLSERARLYEIISKA